MMNKKSKITHTKGFLKYYEIKEKKITLAIEVFEARKKIGISQEELAKKVGTTQTVISNIENANVNIGFNLLFKIFKELSLDLKTISKIFDCKDSKEPLKETLQIEKIYKEIFQAHIAYESPPQEAPMNALYYSASEDYYQKSNDKKLIFN